MAHFLNSNAIAELALERLKPHVMDVVSQNFACAGLTPDRSVLQRCESRAIEIAISRMPSAITTELTTNGDYKGIENAALQTVLRAVRDACLEAAEYERFNPAFCPGQQYSVCEGRDL